MFQLSHRVYADAKLNIPRRDRSIRLRFLKYSVPGDEIDLKFGDALDADIVSRYAEEYCSTKEA